MASKKIGPIFCFQVFFSFSLSFFFSPALLLLCWFFSLIIITLNSSLDSLPSPSLSLRSKTALTWLNVWLIHCCLGVKMSSLAPVWPSACLLCLTSLALLWTHRCFWGNCPTFQKGKIVNDLPVHYHHHHHCGLYLSISPNALSALTAWSPFPEKEINSEQKSSDIFWEPPKASTMSINTERANHFLWHLPMARVNLLHSHKGC